MIECDNCGATLAEAELRIAEMDCEIAEMEREIAELDAQQEQLVPTDRITTGEAWLNAPTRVEAVWGDPESDEVLWARGEPLLLVGPDGSGTLAQQLALRRAGVHAGPLLGKAVEVSTSRVLYVAFAYRSRAVNRTVHHVKKGEVPLARNRSLVLVLIVALPVAVAAGCGGDDETSQTEAPAPTEQEFAAQADAICRSAEQDITAQSEDLGHYSPDGLDEEEVEFIETEIIPFYQRQVDEIRELTPPPGEEKDIEAGLSAAEQDLDDLREDPSGFAPPVGPDGERIDTVPKGWQELARQLKGYGSKACAN